EDARTGTAQLLPRVPPATGRVRAKGVIPAATAVRHPWLQEAGRDGLAALPVVTPPAAARPPLAQGAPWRGPYPPGPPPPRHAARLPRCLCHRSACSGSGTPWRAS